MRYLSLIAILALGACASPAMQQLQAACEGGDTQACETVMNYRMQAAQGMAAYGRQLSTQSAPGYRTRQPITCVQQGVFVNCY